MVCFILGLVIGGGLSILVVSLIFTTNKVDLLEENKSLWANTYELVDKLNEVTARLEPKIKEEFIAKWEMEERKLEERA